MQDSDGNFPSNSLTNDKLIRLESNVYILCTHHDDYIWRSKSMIEVEIIVLKEEDGKLNGTLQMAIKIITNYGVSVSSRTTNAVSKNKKKRFKEDLGFIAIKKNPPK